jgi:3-oxocholest-4-en-26-oate---CoA ligase
VSIDLHFATAWETVADVVPDRLAVVQGRRRLRWSDLDEEAGRVAAGLADLGIGRDSKVGLMLFNDPEYLVAQHAIFKLRGVPVNVNYRYLHDELRYVVENSHTEVLFFDAALVDRVSSLRASVPGLRHLVAVGAGDGSDDRSWDGVALRYDDLLAADPFPRIDRSGDDLYLMYTGGTTGMPKGVMYRIGDFCSAQYMRGQNSRDNQVLCFADIPNAIRARLATEACVSVPASPLMHGMGMWVGAMRALNWGGTVVLLEGRSFAAHELWSAVERERVTSIAIVGDAFARPMLRALEEAQLAGRPYDISSVRLISSSGVAFSRETKSELLERMSAQAEISDALGSTEGGAMGVTLSSRGNIGDTRTFTALPGALVIDSDGNRVEPGSGVAGMVAGRTLAFGYYGDAELTARTFRQIDGVTYSVAGDWATVQDDGAIRLLGRGSQCINTRGEKVYPQEVEAEINAFEGVDDSLVMGIPDDEGGGEEVAAVIAARQPATFDADELRSWLRARIAAFKIPRRVLVVPEIRRAANGKADYGWGGDALDQSRSRI